MATAQALAAAVAASLALVAWSDAGHTREEARSRAETERIRAHLANVERTLLAADIAHLSDAQRQNRARHIVVLREYRERGVFPHNHDVPGQRVPVFIDEHDTHCAVGHLIARSGHEVLARRIAKERNLARVHELADVPGLVAWLEDAGVSLEEAAAIQPAYGGPPLQPVEEQRQTGYPAATAITAALGGAAVLWNALTDRTGSHWWAPGAAGIATGAAGVSLAALGAAMNDGDDDVDSSHIVANAGLGLLAGFLGVRTIALGRASAAAPAENGARSDRAPAFELSAWTPPRGGPGVRIGVRF